MSAGPRRILSVVSSEVSPGIVGKSGVLSTAVLHIAPKVMIHREINLSDDSIICNGFQIGLPSVTSEHSRNFTPICQKFGTVIEWRRKDGVCNLSPPTKLNCQFADDDKIGSSIRCRRGRTALQP